MAIDKFADRLLQHFDNILFCRAGIMIDMGNGSYKNRVILFGSFKGGLNNLISLKNMNNFLFL